MKASQLWHPCIAFALGVALVPSAIAQSAKLYLAETKSTITLSFVPDKQFPNDVRSILIHSSGITNRITAHEQLIRIPATRKEREDAFIWSADVPDLKIDPSRYFLVGRYIADSKRHTLLFFLSDAAASDATPLLIVGFSDQGKPFKVFDRPYELTSFEQTDTGALIVGKESISQAMCDSGDPHAPSSTTYDPYSVSLIRPDSKPTYLLESSRDYNRKHYVWAGPHASEATAVIYNLPGHPRIYAVPASRHNELMTKFKCTP